MNALQRSWDDMARQLRANPRLRLAMIAVGALLAVYGVLALVDLRARVAASYASRVEYMRTLRSLAEQPEWLERAQAAARLRKGLEAQLGRAATTGIAQAEVQSWARERAAAVGGQTQINAQAPAEVEGQPGLWRIPVVLSGSAQPLQVVQLMQIIESAPRLAVIEQANLLNRENRTFSLTVVFFYRIEGGADGAP